MKLVTFFLLFFLEQVVSLGEMDVINTYISNAVEVVETLDISQMCKLQMKLLGDNQEILWKMMDASAKFPYSGILDSGRTELGNFDECISIDHRFNGVKILGKYCFAGLVIPDPVNITNTDLYYKLSTCIPDACSAGDIIKILDSLVIQGFPPLVLDDFCTTKDTGKELYAGNIFAIMFVFLILMLVLCSTAYEVYCLKTEQKPIPLLLAFSAVSNTKNILKVSQTPSKENIQIFSGFRAVSIAWILSSHGIQIFANSLIPMMNRDAGLEIFHRRSSAYVYGGNLAVSTFFFMSGFLLSYLYLKRKPENWRKQLKSIPSFYLYRYLRITASAFILYIFMVYLFVKLGNGPLWQMGCELEISNCKKYWWSYFLYIQNYVNWDNMCSIPLWYLSADMQLFLISPAILIPLSIILKKPKGFTAAMIMLGILNVLSLAMHIGIREYFPETTRNTFDTHGRIGEYLIGITMGVFMRYKKDETFLWAVNRKNVSALNLIIWIIVISAMSNLVLFYPDAEEKFGPTNRTLFISLGRVIWPIGLSWMVYSCFKGYGGVVNWFLCRPLFQVMGKLSYPFYLLHYLVLGHYTFSNRVKLYGSHYIEFYLYCGYFIETLIYSFIWSLGIESPIIIIEKHMFKKTGEAESRNGANNRSEGVA